MALKLALFIAMAAVPAIVGATEFIVGDDDGWRVGVNYTAWAEGKEFRVGDTIVFKYKREQHNVLRVGGAAFSTCNMSSNNQPLDIGNDVIELTQSGRKWYICAVADHCDLGMKLSINVVEAEAPAPSPAGGNENSVPRIASSGCSNLLGLAAVWAMAVKLC